MSRIIVLAFCSILLFACNPNPNKEARLQKVESEIVNLKSELEITRLKVSELEEQLEELRYENEKMSSKIHLIQEKQ